MSNAFDRTNYPTQEPDTIVVGDRLLWRRDDLADTYPTSAYALTYEFHEDSGGGCPGSSNRKTQDQPVARLVYGRVQDGCRLLEYRLRRCLFAVQSLQRHRLPSSALRWEWFLVARLLLLYQRPSLQIAL